MTHLDGRQLLIKSQPGEVVKPDQFKALNDEGMPIYQRPFMRGKLYIHFTVDFPDSLRLYCLPGPRSSSLTWSWMSARKQPCMMLTWRKSFVGNRHILRRPMRKMKTCMVVHRGYNALSSDKTECPTQM
ncbi:hypothetical protein V6N13_000873 [Hibiscus sabdariffa]|uniref:Chaperone DnaJ C-terminal domain-containing protein n=1 Tax=Hibiscus sabdariffa TaxID=183260 RepID=A0ABR2G808_9ROSI